MKLLSSFFICIFAMSIVIAQPSKSASGFSNNEEENFLLQPNQLENLYPYFNKKDFYDCIQQAIKYGEEKQSDYEWVNDLIKSVSQVKEFEEIPVRAIQIIREPLKEADIRHHNAIKHRDQHFSAMVIPEIPKMQSLTSFKNVDISLGHKLDSTRNGSFDPLGADWVENLAFGSLFNDTGLVIGNYTINVVDEQGTTDTIERHYNQYGEDGLLSEKIIYRRNETLNKLLPYEKQHHRYYIPDSTEIIYSSYDIIEDKWVLSERIVSHYVGDLIKRTETYTWNLETEEWKINKKSVLEHTAEGKFRWNNTWVWNETAGELIPYTRFERDYDQFGNEILYERSYWDFDVNDWRTDMKWTYDYGDYNKVLEFKFYFWLADSLGLVQVGQNDYEYLNDTMLVSLTRYNYEQDYAEMIPQQMEEYSYDELFRRDVTLSYNWLRQSERWDLGTKTAYIYDENDLLITTIDSTWREFAQAWSPGMKFENEYDHQERLISVKTYVFPGTSTIWLKYQRTDYVYDNFGNQTEKIDWEVDEWSYEWVPKERRWSVYNEKGFVRRSYSDWDLEAGAWSWSRENFEYSEEGYLEKNDFIKEKSTTMAGRKLRTEMLYNETGMFSGWIESVWDDAGNDWKEEYRGECIYGSHGKITSVKVSYLDKSPDQWVEYYRVDATYDENSRITSQTYLDWDTAMQDWTSWDVDSFAYDDQGRITMMLYLGKDSDLGELRNVEKWEYSYDLAGNPETEESLKWDTTGVAWIPEVSYDYGFNEKNQLISIKKYTWNLDLSRWDGSTIEEISYTAIGNRSQMTRSQWDGIDKIKGLLQVLYIYDGQGNLKTKKTSTWNADGGWIDDLQENYTYESKIDAAEVWLPFDIGYNADEIFEFQFNNDYFEYFYDASIDEDLFYWNFNMFEYTEIHKKFNAPLKVVYQEWNKETDAWRDRQICDLYIYDSHSVVGVPEVNKEADFRIYPNPVEDLLFVTIPLNELDAIENATITIYNLDGRQIMNLVLGETDQINVSHLGSGAYILWVRSVDRSYFGKFIKK